MSAHPPLEQEKQPESGRHERDTFVALAFCWADIVFELDADFQVRFAAGAVQSLTGWSTENLMGQPFSRLFPESDRPRLSGRLQEIREGRRVEDSELVLLGANGRHLPVALAGHSLTPEVGPFYLGLRARGQAGAHPGQRRSSETPDPLFFDGIQHVMLANGVLRVELLQANAGKTTKRAGTLVFPAAQAEPIVQTLVDSLRQIWKKRRASLSRKSE